MRAPQSMSSLHFESLVVEMRNTRPHTNVDLSIELDLVSSNTRDTRVIFNSREEFEEYVKQYINKKIIIEFKTILGILGAILGRYLYDQLLHAATYSIQELELVWN